LRLQDEYRLNVNLLLFIPWVYSSNYSLSGENLSQLRESINDADKAIVEFRQYRRHLKRIQSSEYEQALNKELEMEKKMQVLLVERLNQFELDCPENKLDSPESVLLFYAFHVEKLHSDKEKIEMLLKRLAQLLGERVDD